MKMNISITGIIMTCAILVSACTSAVQSSGIDQNNFGQKETKVMVEESETGEAGKIEDEQTGAGPVSESGMLDEPENTQPAMAESEQSEQAGDNPGPDVADAASSADLPSYFTVNLTHPATGQNFTINDHKGKVILVETMAMWCTTCLRQQGEVKKLHEQLGQRDDFLSLGLDIDPNENSDDLSRYIAENGFDWMYAVAPVEVAREIDRLYGSQFLNPSSAPMFIIDRTGQAHPLPFGVKSAQELHAALEPFLNQDI